MSEENNVGADRAEGGDASRLLLAALAMIVVGVGLWSWDDRRDEAALSGAFRRCMEGRAVQSKFHQDQSELKNSSDRRP